MQIGVPLETAAGETRVSVTPETVKKFTGHGHEKLKGVAAFACPYLTPFVADDGY